jgi:cellulose synthase/poly-beta-1,6-N-acetylglucosamine synthase-like glycosyltransferase
MASELLPFKNGLLYLDPNFNTDNALQRSSFQFFRLRSGWRKLPMREVDVIIPTYNRASLLRNVITSVLNQSFTDFTIIVVDDGSSNNNKAVLESFQDKRIKYVRNEVNMGEGRARNIGVSNSTADYVAFLDDDDEWLPEKLKMQ